MINKGHIRRAILLTVATLTLDAHAQQREAAPSKRAWEYSEAERLAKRFDRASIAARSVDPETKQPRAGTNVIDGATHPELFMPHELYLGVVLDYLTMDQPWVARHRSAAEDHLRIFTDPVDFWAKLEQGSKPYTTALASQARLVEQFRTADAVRRRAVRAQIDAQQVDLCRARAEAMAGVIRLVGRDLFYRFLYEIVAPNIASASDTDEDGTAALLFAERGCR